MEAQGDLIAARATPESVSAIAVVRLSGSGAAAAVEKIMALDQGRLQGMRRVVGNFGGADRLVALSWPPGRSYTGEEMIDLMCHGTPGTADEVLKLLLSAGARAAEPGEFTRRAWLNGRLTAMDVLELSARFRSIGAGETGELQKKLEDLITEIEAIIEFGEEHETADEDRMIRILEEATDTADQLRARAERIEVQPRVFIMGPVNSGKSTLFNFLCGEKAAVVADVPGTTRDGAERTVTLRGKTVRLSDSAGTGGDELDDEALEIALSRLSKGDRIVWMDRNQNEPPSEIQAKYSTLLAASQRDREKKPLAEGWLPISSVTEEGMEEVVAFITGPAEGSPSRVYLQAGELLREAGKTYRAGDLAMAAEIVSMVMDEINAGMKRGEAVERALEVFCVGK